MVNPRLGRGFKAVLNAKAESKQQPHSELRIDLISPNPFQPRKDFDQKQLEELAGSIRRFGVLQPVVVRTGIGGRFELIAGERRWRASQLAGLETIPVVVKEPEADHQMLQLSILENVQREDLNPIEKARGFKQLVAQFGLKQEAIAKSIGLDRSSIANYLRLLELPDEVQKEVSRGTISMGHARAILSFPTPEARANILQRILKQRLSVRDTEALARDGGGQLVVGAGKKKKRPSRFPWVDDLENDLRSRLSARVVISRNAAGRGRMTIEFATDPELERIVEMIRRGN